jgi:hypothetical protein
MTHAEKAIVTMIDFIIRGARLMMSRVLSPRQTRISWCAIAWTCQLSS